VNFGGFSIWRFLEVSAFTSRTSRAIGTAADWGLGFEGASEPSGFRVGEISIPRGVRVVQAEIMKRS
jgi:hypothetical protein